MTFPRSAAGSTNSSILRLGLPRVRSIFPLTHSTVSTTNLSRQRSRASANTTISMLPFGSSTEPKAILLPVFVDISRNSVSIAMRV